QVANDDPVSLGEPVLDYPQAFIHWSKSYGTTLNALLICDDPRKRLCWTEAPSLGRNQERLVGLTHCHLNVDGKSGYPEVIGIRERCPHGDRTCRQARLRTCLFPVQ